VSAVSQELYAVLRVYDFRKAIAVLKKALKTLKEEDIEALAGELYQSLANIYSALNEKDEALYWAGKTLDIQQDYIHLAPRNRTADLEELMKEFSEPVV